MDLFSELENDIINIFNHDGLVDYYGFVFNDALADYYFNELVDNIEWKNDEVVINHQKNQIEDAQEYRIKTKRLVAFYAEQPLTYTYSKITKIALPFTLLLHELKTIVEQKTQERFNSCLLNLYHDGSEGMAWHSDNDPDLKPYAAIASLSFGAQRKFSFKHKVTKETKSLNLKHGSLLVMKNNTQHNWLHALPTTKKVTDMRINLTFRTVINR